MSDSDSLSSSGSSSEDESDYGEQSNVTRAYQDEPLAREVSDVVDDGENVDEDGISRASLEARYEGNTPVNEWCQCQKCSVANLEGSMEYRCCMGKTPKCITEHEDYQILSQKVVLETVGPLLTDKQGKRYQKGQHSQNEYLRAVAYRWLIRWLCGSLGWDNARPLPACLYENLRTRFTCDSNWKTGYKSSERRDK